MGVQKPQIRPFIYNPHGTMREENFSDHRGKWGKWAFPWSKAGKMCVQSKNMRPAMSSRPRLRNNIKIRRESFGAIIFDPSNSVYYEINHPGLNLLSLFDGTRTESDVKLVAKGKLDLRDKETRDFLGNLKRYNLLG